MAGGAAFSTLSSRGGPCGAWLSCTCRHAPWHTGPRSLSLSPWDAGVLSWWNVPSCQHWPFVATASFAVSARAFEEHNAVWLLFLAATVCLCNYFIALKTISGLIRWPTKPTVRSWRFWEGRKWIPSRQTIFNVQKPLYIIFKNGHGFNIKNRAS